MCCIHPNRIIQDAECFLDNANNISRYLDVDHTQLFLHIIIAQTNLLILLLAIYILKKATYFNHPNRMNSM